MGFQFFLFVVQLDIDQLLNPANDQFLSSGCQPGILEDLDLIFDADTGYLNTAGHNSIHVSDI